MVTSPSLRAAIAAIPPDCYVRPTWRGLAYVGRDALLYALGITLLLATDRPAFLVPLWIMTALAVSALFVIGHDAAHGALFRSARLNTTIARLAFLPSLHALAAWQAGHNRVHHGHTGRQGIDFVWHPLSPAEYAGLPGWRRVRHRIEWSPWGAGVYYLRAVWWARIVRLAPPARLRAAFRHDRRLVVAAATLASVALLAVGCARSGSLVGAGWAWTKTLVVPWLLFNWIIGVTVYVHHIAPDVPWQTRATWTQLRGQVDGTRSYRLPAWLNFFWHNVYVHAPHHVDPRIPFYHLPRAAEALEPVLGQEVRPRRLALADYVAITRRCKLFDFERGIWVDYGAR